MKKILVLILILAFSMAHAQPKSALLFVGTYTNSCDSDGIYAYTFNLDTAEASPVSQTHNIVSPSYLSISQDRNFIYSVNENGDNSSISAFAFDRVSFKIKLLNQMDSNGASPCYIIDDDHNLIVANYSGGTIAVFGKSSQGAIGVVKQVVTHHGSGPNHERQEKAHVHMVAFSPDRKYLLANDLGTDEISIYNYNPISPTIVLSLKSKVKVKPGSGPRHLTFSSDGKFVYSIHELDGTLTTFAYNDGKLEKIDETTVVQPGFTGKTGAADIHTTADGKFLYATNRGDANTISVFALDNNGKPSHVETVGTEGKGPRNFVITPGGKFVLVAHQDSNEIVIFSRDQRTGKLSATGQRIALCAPVCLKFMQQ
jgi:6-phosphogluconolactonase